MYAVGQLNRKPPFPFLTAGGQWPCCCLLSGRLSHSHSHSLAPSGSHAAMTPEPLDWPVARVARDRGDHAGKRSREREGGTGAPAEVMGGEPLSLVRQTRLPAVTVGRPLLPPAGSLVPGEARRQ